MTNVDLPVRFRVSDDLAGDLLAGVTDRAWRAAPDVRNDLAVIGDVFMTVSTGAANLATLIVARDSVRAFVLALLTSMRRKPVESVEFFYQAEGRQVRITIRQTDGINDVLPAFVKAIDAISGEGEHATGGVQG